MLAKHILEISGNFVETIAKQLWQTFGKYLKKTM